MPTTAELTNKLNMSFDDINQAFFEIAQENTNDAVMRTITTTTGVIRQYIGDILAENRLNNNLDIIFAIDDRIGFEIAQKYAIYQYDLGKYAPVTEDALDKAYDNLKDENFTFDNVRQHFARSHLSEIAKYVFDTIDVTSVRFTSEADVLILQTYEDYMTFVSDRDREMLIYGEDVEDWMVEENRIEVAQYMEDYLNNYQDDIDMQLRKDLENHIIRVLENQLEDLQSDVDTYPELKFGNLADFAYENDYYEAYFNLNGVDVYINDYIDDTVSGGKVITTSAFIKHIDDYVYEDFFNDYISDVLINTESDAFTINACESDLRDIIANRMADYGL